MRGESCRCYYYRKLPVGSSVVFELLFLLVETAIIASWEESMHNGWRSGEDASMLVAASPCYKDWRIVEEKKAKKNSSFRWRTTKRNPLTHNLFPIPNFSHPFFSPLSSPLTTCNTHHCLYATKVSPGNVRHILDYFLLFIILFVFAFPRKLYSLWYNLGAYCRSASHCPMKVSQAVVVLVH